MTERIGLGSGAVQPDRSHSSRPTKSPTIAIVEAHIGCLDERSVSHGVWECRLVPGSDQSRGGPTVGDEAGRASTSRWPSR